MKLLRIVAVFGFLFSGIIAQQVSTVSGKIVAGLSNTPVKAAVVLSQDGREIRRIFSDDNGFYQFDGITPGDYKIEVEYEQPPGVTTIKEEKELHVSGNSKITLDFSLGVFMSRLYDIPPLKENVTVSAGSSQPIEQVSKTVDIIDGQEMRERADFSLVDSLRSIPGFRVQQLGGFGKTANIKTRGLRNQDTAVLIDGVRFRDPTAITGDASPFLSDFTLTSVSKVEVLRGSGSSLYGTNAIGGVVDFQTPEPQRGWHGQFSGAAGGLGLGRVRGNISDGTHDGKFGFNVGVSRTAYTKGIDGDDNANNTNLQSRIEFRPTSKTNLSGRFFFSDAFVRLNSNPDTTANVPLSNFGIIDAREGVTFIPDVDDPDDTQKSRFFDGQLIASQIINPRLVFNGYYSGLTTRRRNDTGPLGIGFQSASTSIFDGQIHTANGHFTWTPNSINEVTAGYEFEYERFGNEGSTPDALGNFAIRAAQSSHTLYAQDLVSLLQGRLQLAGGVRAQFFNLAQPRFSLTNAPYSDVILSNPPTAVTFDGAASYFFRQTGTKLRAHVGNGYRVPSLFERFGTFFDNFSVPNQFVALGDPGLRPEKSIAADAGIEQDVLKGKLHLTAIYFYTDLTNIINFGNVAPPVGSTDRPFGGYENQKGGIARGAEFSSTLKPRRSTDIFASYTFTSSLQRDPQVAGSGVIESLAIPKHQFTLVATQRIRRFWVNFDFLGTSDYLAPVFSNASFNTYVFRFRGNRRGDLTAGYNFGWKQDRLNLRVFGTIENLFDDRYFENGFRTPGRNARAGFSFGF
ncbi:MAG TPA: TonB-dependent receptor [Pyrinomonadaceae bacterium]